MKKFLKKYWFTLLIVLIFLAILFINYFDVLKFNYPVPPGNDPVTHLTIINEILKTGKTTSDIYPPAFHYLIAGFSKLLNVDPIKVMVYFYPFLMFLTALAVYLFSNRFFGKAVGVLVLIIYGFLSPQPRQTLWDGGFPNLLSANFLMILGFLFFLKSYKNEKRKDAIFAGLFLGLVPFFHHFSSFLMVALTIFLAVALLIFSVIRKDNLKRKGLVFGLMIAVALIIGIYPAYAYFGKVFLRDFLASFTVYAAHLNKLIDGVTFFAPQSPAMLWKEYVLVLSPVLWFLGWLSLPFLFRGFIKEKKEEYLFVFIWLIGVSILSRPFFLSPLPGRIVRELAIPLSICSGIFLKETFWYFKSSWQKIVLVILIGLFLIKGFFVSLGWVGKYNPMVFIRDLDNKALQWVKTNTPKNANFVVAPYNFWFGFMTHRQNIGNDFDMLKYGDYLYINRWQNDFLWEDKNQYLKIRDEVYVRTDLELVKNFGEDNEKGITIYKINH